MKQIAAVLFLALAAGGSGLGKSGSPDITADELQAHVRYLASDELEGRLAGTEGSTKASEYIAKEFASYGLLPGGDDDSYFQRFDFVSSVRLGDQNSLVLRSDGLPDHPAALKADVDFRPLGFTTNGTVSGSLAFAGYGISAPEKGYDDYAKLNVEGKLVIVLRYTPDGSDPRSELYRFSSFREKARVAREKGAVALLVVAGPADEQDDDLVKLRYDQSLATSGIAAVAVKRTVVSPFLARMGTDLKTIQDSIKAGKKPVAFELPGTMATLTTDVVQTKAQSANVVGYLEGRDPILKDEIVIVGAHFDHIGFGGPGSGSLVPDTHAVHNGADDNASGVAGLLEIAEALARSSTRPSRTFLFVSFTGEELGALGSTYYVNHPRFPLSHSVTMLNLDMIGRMEKEEVTIEGTGSTAEWEKLLTKYNSDSSLVLKFHPSGFGPSDHAQFYAKDIPVLFFWTGNHGDYHKPTDDWDRLNYAGEEKLVKYVYQIAREIGSLKQKPVFVRSHAPGPSMAGGDSRGFSVTLGIVPDYGQSSEGMKISGISWPNGPAEKAGLKPGDIIVKFAGKKIMNIYDYMGVLGTLHAGDEVEIEALRDGKPLKVVARMDKRK